jgi:WD40 repeat protein
MEDRTMKMKFKGLLNEKLPIRASFSEDGRYVICGSEDQEVYIWNSVGKVSNSVIELAKDHNAQYEHFKAHDDSCTVALFVPRQAIEFSSALEVNKIKHMFVSAGFDGTIRFYESRHK